MAHRFVLQVYQLDPLWRVTVRDMGRLRPEFSRDYPSRGEALAYAKGRAAQMVSLGETARVVSLDGGRETVVWDGSEGLPSLDQGHTACPST